MKKYIYKNISGKKVLFLFGLTNLIYLLMLLVTIPKLISFSGGLKIPDMMPMGYDYEYIKNLFDTLGSEGRNFYLFRQLPLDLLYPGLFAMSYCLLFSWFLNKLGKFNSRMFYLSLLPVFSGLFDYCENFGTISMLNSYPDISILQVQITNFFSVAKSFTTAAFFLVLIVVIVIFGLNKLRNMSKLRNIK